MGPRDRETGRGLGYIMAMPFLPRRAACCLALGLALFGTEAGAMFIVNQPWVLPAAKGRSTEAYMDLTSSDATALVAARSDVAREVRIVGQGRRAQKLPELALPAGRMIRLAPHGYRLMLDQVTRPIKRGERVQLTLVIEAADGTKQEIPVNAEARFDSPLEAERRAHQH
jgi:copper(I)-binding protein